jgi:8-oxo-dGTP diphosphatase
MGENPKEALRRELIEEMEVDIELGDMQDFLIVDHQYPDFKITMHSFLCPMKSELFTLNEHVDHKWMYTENLNILDWAPADWPIVTELMKKGL